MFFFPIHLETRFQAVLNLNYAFDSLNLEPKAILKNYWASLSQYIKPKVSENAYPFQTHWQIVSSVTRNVLHYWIAMWKPKTELETIKHSYFYTVNPKFAWKCRAFHNSSQKGYSTPRLQLNKYVQDVQVPLTPKPSSQTTHR